MSKFFILTFKWKRKQKKKYKTQKNNIHCVIRICLLELIQIRGFQDHQRQKEFYQVIF